MGSTQTSKLSASKPFCGDVGTNITAAEIRESLGRAEVNGKTVTLLRRSLNSVPEITNAGRVLRISVPSFAYFCSD